MCDREYFKRRAEAERAAVKAAKDVASARAHMTLVREYDWRVATEPRPDCNVEDSLSRQGGSMRA
jgi:hypothetical protein